MSDKTQPEPQARAGHKGRPPRDITRLEHKLLWCVGESPLFEPIKPTAENIKAAAEKDYVGTDRAEWLVKIGYTPAFTAANKKAKQQQISDLNIDVAIRRAGVQCRFNLFNKETEITIGAEERYAELLDESGMLPMEFRWLIASAVGARLHVELGIPATAERVMKRMEILARGNKYHSVGDWLKSLDGQWDGVDRLPTFMEQIQLASNYSHKEMAQVYMRKALRQVPQAVIGNVEGEPKALDFVVVLVSHEKRRGKTKFVQGLLPNPEWIG